MLRKLNPTEEFKFNRAQIRTKQDLQNYLTEDFSLIFFEQFSSGKGNSNWNRSYELFVYTYRRSMFRETYDIIGPVRLHSVT